MLVWRRSLSPGHLSDDLERYSEYRASDVEFDATQDGEKLKVRRPLAGPRSMPG
jgi:hypothetical protein